MMQELATAPLSVLREAWDIAFSQSTNGHRDELADHLTALAPVLFTLGGAPLAESLVRSVLRIYRWWPYP